VRITFEKWPVSGQRVWTFTNHTGQLFLMAPFGPLTSWRVYGWPSELDFWFRCFPPWGKEIHNKHCRGCGRDIRKPVKDYIKELRYRLGY